MTDPRAHTSPDELPSYHEASLPPLHPPALMDAHNVWLNVAGQAGALGLAAFVWVLLALAIPLRRVRFRRGSGLEALPNALLAAFAGAVLFGGLFAAIEEARHLWALFGLMAATPVVHSATER